MSATELFAGPDLGHMAQWAIRTLGTAVGVVAGSMLFGLLTPVLSRLISGKGPPRKAIWAMRVSGAVAGGLLLWFLLAGLNLGGWGFGSGNSSGNGKGTDKGRDEKKEKKEDDTQPKKDRDTDNGRPAETIRVAVLGEAPLKELQGGGPVDITRCYRIEDGDKALYDLPKLQKELRLRRDKAPGLKVQLVRYKDSPDRDNSFVSDLWNWLKDERLFKDWETPPRPAPR
jgi:hypothetical protein